METRTVHISTLTFIKIIVIALSAIFLFLVRDILAMIFLAIVLASAMKPGISWMMDKRVPKTLAIGIIYVIFISIIMVLMVIIVPPVSREITQLANHFPEYYEKINLLIAKFDTNIGSGESQLTIANMGGGLSNTLGSVFSTTFQVFSGVFTFITILILAFYFANEEGNMRKFLRGHIPGKKRDYIVDLIAKIQTKLGYWFLGQVLLCLIVFGATFLLLFVFGIKYALILAIMAGIFEIIPFFGPWISGIVGVLITFSTSPTKAIIVAIIYLSVQQAEAAFIVPKVMSKSLGLNPLLVVIAILIGFQIGGVIGALIAVPFVAMLSVLVDDLLSKRND